MIRLKSDLWVNPAHVVAMWIQAFDPTSWQLVVKTVLTEHRVYDKSKQELENLAESISEMAQ